MLRCNISSLKRPCRTVMSQLTIILIRKYPRRVLHRWPVSPAGRRARDVYLSVPRNHRSPDSPRRRTGRLDPGRSADGAAGGRLLRTVRAGGTRTHSGTRLAGTAAHRSRVRLDGRATSPLMAARTHAGTGVI